MLLIVFMMMMVVMRVILWDKVRGQGRGSWPRLNHRHRRPESRVYGRRGIRWVVQCWWGRRWLFPTVHNSVIVRFRLKNHIDRLDGDMPRIV